jgi:3-methyladenine DNA glycosylase/8-oxoguanine DNA glycosylase
MANLRSSVRHLKRVDQRLAAVIDAVGPCRYATRVDGTHYEALSRSIIYQQLSGKAAATIQHRYFALFAAGAPEPAEMLGFNDAALRGAGLSRQKISYLRDLSRKTLDGDLPLDEIETLTDDDVIERLTCVKGIGRWTAQMFLMFRLGRLDVLAELDLGVQTGIQRAYRMRKRPTPKQVKKIGAKWSPHSTVACWYLWRSLDTGDGQLAE